MDIILNNSFTNNKQEVIVLSCVDAGAANYFIPLLSSHKLHTKNLSLNVYASGVAAKKFNEASIDFIRVEESEWNALNQLANNILDQVRPTLLVCGTSWGMTLDKALIAASAKRGIRSISVIDHWTLFRQRYCNVEMEPCADDLHYLTDYCIVIDENARKKAEIAGLGCERLRIGGHPFLEEVELRSAQLSIDPRSDCCGTRRVLFVSEQIREDLGPFSIYPFDEFSVLEDLCEVTNRLGMRLDVKLHPQEEVDKYKCLNLESYPKLNVFKEMNFETMLNDYDFIVGIDSMLLVELGVCRMNVISYHPGVHKHSEYLDEMDSIIEIGNVSFLEDILCSTPPDSKQMSAFLSKRSQRFRGSAQRVWELIIELGEESE